MSFRLLTVAALVCCSCAGELTNPSRFLDDQGDACADMDVVAEILAADTCSNSGCHDVDAPAAGLDLQSPGVAARLLDVASNNCSDRLLIDSGNRGTGYFLESLEQTPSCGSQMPIGAPLSAEQIGCLQAWVEGL